MESRIYPMFSVGVFCPEANDNILNAKQKTIRHLRSQGFRIHDFGLLGSRENHMERIDDSDVFIIFCTPDMKAYGDLLFITGIPGVREKMKGKPCIPVLVNGTKENAVPDWTNEPVIDCRANTPGYDLHNMDIPLGVILRDHEFRKLAKIREKERKNICIDCVSVYRARKLERFIFHNSPEEEYVRVMLALGPNTPPPASPFPECIVFEDPYNFLPDSNGNVALKIARVEGRDLDPASTTFGAYHLSNAASFRVPKELLYEDHPKLVKIAASVHQQITGSAARYVEADLNLLYLMDMEIWPPLPSENEIEKTNAIRDNMHRMETAVDIMVNGFSDKYEIRKAGKEPEQ